MDVATRVAEKLRTDHRVADFIDSAICIAAFDDGCDATLVERLEVMQIMSEIPCRNEKPAQAASVDLSFAVLIADKRGATCYKLPHPRLYPELWPWTPWENRDS
jgi:hypothetical protein